MAGSSDTLGRVTFQDKRQLIGASFRGVPFFVETAERGGGRRTVKHEFPLRDTPFVEDLGRKARTFPVEGYVVGPDYRAHRDALISALEAAGPGELVHPTYGARRVACADFRVRESIGRDGGWAQFGLEFDETSTAPEAPTASPAVAQEVGASADATVAAVRARAATVAALDVPSSALASAAAVIADAARAMTDALLPLTTGAQELAALKRQLDNLILDADALAAAPADAVDAFAAAVLAFQSPVNPPRLGALGLLAAYAFVPSVARPLGSTASRIAEQALYDLVLDATRTVLVIEAARVAVGETYDSYDAAVSMRDVIAAALDTLSLTADDEAFAAIDSLRADLVRALPGVDSDLPRLAEHVPAFTVPSLVLAHRLYGDVTREADIVTRNAIERPGFIGGGSVLEILSA